MCSIFFPDSHYFIYMTFSIESYEEAIWGREWCWYMQFDPIFPIQLVQRKTILLEEHELSLCFPWGTRLHFLGEISQIIVQFYPIFLVKLQKRRRRKRVETNLPRRRGIGAWWLSLGTCKRAWNSLGNMSLLQAMKEHGETMFVHDNLGPFVSGNYVSTRNLSLFALGNQVSLRI